MKRISIYMFIFVFSTFSHGFTQSQEEIKKKISQTVAKVESKKKSLTHEQKKISSLLRDKVLAIDSLKNFMSFYEIKKKLGKSSIRFDSQERIRLKVVLNENLTKIDFENVILSLEQKNCQITNKFWPEEFIQWRPEIICYADYFILEEIAGFEHIATIQPVIDKIINIGDSLTEGDLQLLADEARAQCDVTGSGIRVGVVSTAAESRSVSVSSGDLPNDIIIVADDGNDEEGTAMMEIIYDLAPQCSFGFASAGNSSNEMKNRIGQLIGADGDYCKIVVDDIGWPGDPYFTDGLLAQYIGNIIDYNNIIYISAAGNDSEVMYTAEFNEHIEENNTWHNFYYTGSENNINNTIFLRNNQKVEIILQWADDWEEPQADFDVYLSTLFGDDKGSGGKDPQGSGSENPPKEVLTFTNDTGGDDNFNIRIKMNELSPNTSFPKLKLFVVNRTRHLGHEDPNLQFTHQYNEPLENQVYGHAAAEGVISVAAYDWQDEDNLEVFSSRGPTYIDNTIDPVATRSTPTITATDGVTTTIDNFNPFYGTSAAAPHIAGIAALYKEKYSAASPEDFYDDLTQNGTDIMGYKGGEWNNESGFGKADALATIGPCQFSVKVDQQKANGVSIDSVGHWESNWKEYEAGYTFSWAEAETHTLQADTNMLEGEKFHDWQGNIYINYNKFKIQSGTTEITAHLNPSKEATIGTELLSGGTGGDIEFKDPWFRDFNEPPYGIRNRGMDGAPFKSLGNSFNLNMVSDYQGVFLGEDPQSSNIYYSIQAKEIQTFPAHGLDTDWYFQGWETDGANITEPDNNEGDYYQSPVVFTSDNSVIEATYKGHGVSNEARATGYNNGRRIVREDANTLHLVYEDDGDIWYTYSADNGQSWHPEERICGGDEETTCAHPSLALAPDDGTLFSVWDSY